MATTIWIDGQYYDRDTAKVSVFDHGLLYGDGVFEGIRAYDGKIFRLRQHLERLYDSAKAIALTIPMTIEEMTTMTEEALTRSAIGNAYLRLLVTRGVGDLGLDPRNCPKPTVVLIVDTIKLFNPEVLAPAGLTVVTAGTPIPNRESLSPRVKSLELSPAHHGQARGDQCPGADEVIMLEAGGTVAEGSGTNLFIMKDGVLKTTPPWAGILQGVTRDAVLELAHGMGMPVQETMLNRYDIYTADEAFFTGTASELVAIRSVDNRQIGAGAPGPQTKRLQEAYAALIRA